MWHDLYLGDDPHPRRYVRREDALQAAMQLGRLDMDTLGLLAALGEVQPPEAPLRVRLRRLPQDEGEEAGPES